jgi:hypothetical protein
MPQRAIASEVRLVDPPDYPASADVHIVGVSSQAAGHNALVPDLLRQLSAQGMGHVLVVCGGIIPKQASPGWLPWCWLSCPAGSTV